MTIAYSKMLGPTEIILLMCHEKHLMNDRQVHDCVLLTHLIEILCLLFKSIVNFTVYGNNHYLLQDEKISGRKFPCTFQL